MEIVEGLPELMAKLERLAMDAAPKAGAAGARAGMSKIAVALRKAVGSSNAPDEVKKQARRTIASRVRKGKGSDRGITVAKVGFGVGKTTEKQTAKQATRRGGHKGVGIGKQNINWFVLGTKERFTKSVTRRQASARIGRKSGKIMDRFKKHPTGKVKPYFVGILSAAVASVADQAMAAARDKMSQVMAKELTK